MLWLRKARCLARKAKSLPLHLYLRRPRRPLRNPHPHHPRPRRRSLPVHVLRLKPKELEQALRVSEQQDLAQEWNLPPPPVPPELQHLNLLDWALVHRLHLDLMYEKNLYPLQ